MVPDEIVTFKAETELLKRKFAEVEEEKVDIVIENGLRTSSANHSEALTLIDFAGQDGGDIKGDGRYYEDGCR